MFSLQTWLSALLFWASLVASRPAGKPLEKRMPKNGDNGYMYIGYRRVAEAQANMYRDAGNKLTYQAGFGGTQLGQGVYMTNKIDGWTPENPNDWYCVIMARPGSYNMYSKAWIPAYDPDVCDTELWWEDANIKSYLRRKSLSDTKTILLSVISQIGGWQMLLPAAILNEIDAKVACLPASEKPAVQRAVPFLDLDWANEGRNPEYRNENKDP